MHSRHPVTPPPRLWRNGAIAVYILHCTVHALQCTVNGDDAAVFHFCPWWPWPLTLTFKLIRARNQTRLPCEFGTNLFSGSRDIWGTNRQKVTDSVKNRTLLACSNNKITHTKIVTVMVMWLCLVYWRTVILFFALYKYTYLLTYLLEWGAVEQCNIRTLTVL